MTGDEFSNYLLAGEQLVWWDRPAQGIMLTAQDGFLIPFSLLWAGFAAFWENSVVATHAPLFFKLWGIPFVVAGLYFVFGRFVVDAWLRRNTMYALTNRRALIVRTPPFPNFTALNIEQLPVTTLLEGRNGRGTIRFGAVSQSSTTMFGYRGRFSSWMPALDPTPQFLAIADAQRVFGEIQKRQPQTSAATAR
jgi:hypothetical protein